MGMRHHYQTDLNALYQLILKLGSMVEAALNKAITALSIHDTDLAATVIAGDGETHWRLPLRTRRHVSSRWSSLSRPIFGS